jgi:hypothetical protein
MLVMIILDDLIDYDADHIFPSSSAQKPLICLASLAKNGWPAVSEHFHDRIAPK